MTLTIRDQQKATLITRIDDLVFELQKSAMIKPKLYYKLLPHLTAMRSELRPFYRRWLK